MRQPVGGRLRRKLFERQPDEEVAEEIAFHLEERARELAAGGMDPVAARAVAAARFGDVESVRRECAQLLAAERRAADRRDWFGDLTQDLRFGWRSALRAPLFSLLALLTLAVGIGANAAVFSVVKAVLLDSLPFRDPGQLVRLYSTRGSRESEPTNLSAGALLDLDARQRSLLDLGGFRPSSFDSVWQEGTAPRVVRGGVAAGDFFRTLDVEPLLGRTLTERDAFAGAAPVVLLSHSLWTRDFGAARDVVGRSMRLDGELYEIVGVLPPGFVGPMGPVDLFFPLRLDSVLGDPVRARQQHWLSAVGRLAPGASLESLQRELDGISAQLAREHPASDAGKRLTARPLHEAMVGDTRTPLLALMASAALVLLVACANLASALLSRTLARRRELAVRVALGAGRGRLVRQLLTETTGLALCGGIAGLGLAAVLLELLRNATAAALPAHADPRLDFGALLFAGALALATGLLCGLAAALSLARADPQSTLRDASRTASEGRRAWRLRGALVAVQVALSLSLLVGAGLLVRSLLAMSAAPLGFRAAGVLTFRVNVPADYENDAALRRGFETRLDERLRALPGVTAVATTSELAGPRMNRNGLDIEQAPRPPGVDAPVVPYLRVSDDYFRLLEIPLRRGRLFGSADHPDAPLVFVVSEGMARRYWPDGGALGARVRLGPDDRPWGEIVGIVGDVRGDPARPEAEPTAYVSTRQDPPWGRTLLLRTAGDPLALLAPARRELARLDPTLALLEPATLRAHVDAALAPRRLSVLLGAAFGALTLLLVSVGVYALFAASAAARERELAIRVALGSSRRALATLVLRQGGGWMAGGLVLGSFGIVLVARLLRDLLFTVHPFDLVAVGAALATLLAGASLALAVPLRRVARVDPMNVLR